LARPLLRSRALKVLRKVAARSLTDDVTVYRPTETGETSYDLAFTYPPVDNSDTVPWKGRLDDRVLEPMTGIIGEVQQVRPYSILSLEPYRDVQRGDVARVKVYDRVASSVIVEETRWVTITEVEAPNTDEVMRVCQVNDAAPVA
jgi:hypothetical protein